MLVPSLTIGGSTNFLIVMRRPFDLPVFCYLPGRSWPSAQKSRISRFSTFPQCLPTEYLVEAMSALGQKRTSHVEDAVTVEPVGDFTLKGISRPVAAYNVLSAVSSKI